MKMLPTGVLLVILICFPSQPAPADELIKHVDENGNVTWVNAGPTAAEEKAIAERLIRQEKAEAEAKERARIAAEQEREARAMATPTVVYVEPTPAPSQGMSLNKRIRLEFSRLEQKEEKEKDRCKNDRQCYWKVKDKYAAIYKKLNADPELYFYVEDEKMARQNSQPDKAEVRKEIRKELNARGIYNY